MAKFSALPPAGAFDGNERIAFFQNGQLVSASIFALSAYLASNPEAPPPFFAIAPFITGTATVGQTLTGEAQVDQGNISARQWLRDDVAIAGATGATYELTAADVGALITFRVTGDGPGGSVTATSDPVGPVAASGAPAIEITGSRLAVMGDSRSANGLSPQELNGTGFGTGIPMGTRVQGIPAWMCHALEYRMNVTGQWTRGGGKSSEFCHDFALATVAATNPDAIIYLGTTNDPVDYTGANGFAPIPLGDPAADPATLARVGAVEPTAPATSTQGTTLGNLDKLLRFWADGAANGLGRSVPVILFEIPCATGGRLLRNANVNNWLRARAADGTYPNLIFPEAYEQLEATPGADRTEPYSGLWRTDIESTVGPLAANSDQLHPAGAGARLVGEFIAADIAPLVANLPVGLKLPDGTNDADFVNQNPFMKLGGGGGGKVSYSGNNLPTGSVPDGWTVNNRVNTGIADIAVSQPPGGHGIRLNITRSGGSSATIGQNVEVRGPTDPFDLVVGDTYRVHAHLRVPARPLGEMFAVSAKLAFFEAGLENPAGVNIQTGDYQTLASNSPQPFPYDGDELRTVSVPFEVTQDMVDSVTGTVSITPIVDVIFRDNLDTAANGALQVDVLGVGIERLDANGQPVTASTPTPTPPASSSLIDDMSAAGGANAFHDFADADVAAWSSTDKTTNGNDFVQTVTFRKPLAGSPGAVFDNVSKRAEQATPSSTVTFVLSMTAQTDLPNGGMLGDPDNLKRLEYNSNSLLPLDETIVINGATMGTRQDFYNALATGNEVVLRWEGAIFPTPGLYFLGGGVFEIRRVAVIDHANPPGADLAAAIARAETEVAA